MKLTNDVQTEIKEFLTLYIDDFKKEALSFGLFDPDDWGYIEGYQITFGVSEKGDSWGYQTGDNSYSGGAYSSPYWSVAWITPDTTVEDLYQEIIDQFDMIEVFD